MISDDIVNIYADPMVGGELPFFTGKQYGNGLLSALGRIAFPILKFLGKKAAGFFSNVTSDVLENNSSIKDALKSNALHEINENIPKLGQYIGNKLKGKGIKRKSNTARPLINKRPKTIF